MAYPLATDTGVSERDFLQLPESLERVELLDGEVIVSPSPGLRHQRVVGRLHAALFAWAQAHPPSETCVAPLDVRFAPNRILQPDLFVVLAGLPSDADTPLDIVPDLVVEVLSSRRAYDRILKRTVYGEAGVREYWMVDPEQRIVEVQRAGEGLATVAEGALTTRLLDGFALELEALFGVRGGVGA